MKYVRSIGVGLLIVISKLLPFNWIIGSYHLTFSWTTMMAPVVVQQFGFAWIGLFFLHQKLFISRSIFMTLLYRVPLLFSAWAFTKRTIWTSLMVPIACMTMFVSHDIGSQAWIYALYWLIPMILFCVRDSIVARSMSASFVAHAVGSVIWLYFENIAPAVWISLLPIVFCERVLMAGGMLVLQYLIIKVRAMSLWRAYAIRLGIA